MAYSDMQMALRTGKHYRIEVMLDKIIGSRSKAKLTTEEAEVT
jgi:hypothetical protein